MPDERLDCYVICHPGLEPVTGAEMRALGLDVGDSAVGGVSFRGGMDDVMRANLHLRTAGRVLVRLGAFRATAFWELEKRARSLPWGDFLGRESAVRVRATCRKSRLYHSDGVAERIADAASRGAGARLASGKAGSEDEDADPDDAQLVVARIVHDRCTVSLDTSGALLHRRGYRQALARAPLRETMAAALLLASGWDARSPLLDPMCGSGTIPIEGALMARRIAPGARRDFAFLRWPGVDRARWEAMLAEARAGELAASPAPTATAASTPCQPTPSHASSCARRTSSCRSSVLCGLRPSCTGWLLMGPQPLRPTRPRGANFPRP